MDKKQQTADSYNKYARALAKKFNAMEARKDDIQEVFDLLDKENPHVLEIGYCGGRDAEEIAKLTNNYIGIDITREMSEIARERLPEINFQTADVENYDFPDNLDIVFAFASLIHSSKEKLEEILSKIYAALNPGGIVRLSMKHADVYTEFTKEDEFGTRTYYLYSKKDIEDIAGDFIIVKNELKEAVGQIWLEIILEKA